MPATIFPKVCGLYLPPNQLADFCGHKHLKAQVYPFRRNRQLISKLLAGYLSSSYPSLEHKSVCSLKVGFAVASEAEQLILKKECVQSMRKHQSDGRIRYLLVIYEISRQKEQVKSIDVAKTLNVSRASVHNMMQTLADEGLVTKDYYGDIVLTEGGWAEASRRYEQYQCVCEMFTRWLELPLEQAQSEAMIFLATQTEDTAKRVVQVFASLSTD